MVQTLQDMLDDRTNSGARTLVWLRVALETPISIVQENISVGGEKVMDKLTTISNKKLAIGFGVLILVVMVIGLTFGRDALFSRVANILYSHSTQTTETTANYALGNPFSLLTSTDPKPDTSCSVAARGIISTEVNCQSTMHAYTKLGQSPADEAKVMKSVGQIESMLKTLNYSGGSNSVTFTSLVSGTYKGIDWSPDAFYQKVSGSTDCMFDTQIAYSNLAHQQPAISLTLTCSRTIDILGTPAHETYVSSNGL